jgi:hypothetical protein
MPGSEQQAQALAVVELANDKSAKALKTKQIWRSTFKIGQFL